MGGILLNSASIFSEKGIFLNHHFNNYMLRKDRLDVKAYEVGFNNRADNIKKVFGEFFEREILINNNDSNEKQKICTSLIDGSNEIINKDNLVFQSSFVDSCGMASHTRSDKVIKSAFLEFFERQSLITCYLSKTSGQRISLWSFDNYHNYLLHYVNEVYYFNISLSSKVFVILTLGLGEGNSKCVGLGTAFNLEEAIKKSQIESLQYYATAYTKNNIRNLTQNEPLDTNKDLYHRNFDAISPHELKEMYQYLFDETNIDSNIISLELKNDVNDLLTSCHKELGMNPSVVFFPNYRNIPHLKIVKVIDENWFPHLNPKLYSEKIKEYVSDILGVTIYNDSWIPFP